MVSPVVASAPAMKVQEPLPPVLVNWQFADPAADVLVGVNLRELDGSVLGRYLATWFGAARGLSEGDIQHLLAGVYSQASSNRSARLCFTTT